MNDFMESKIGSKLSASKARGARHPVASSEGGAEGVGFEPTVGCPTLDFESSALNRTQPPFLFSKIGILRCDPN